MAKPKNTKNTKVTEVRKIKKEPLKSRIIKALTPQSNWENKVNNLNYYDYRFIHIILIKG